MDASTKIELVRDIVAHYIEKMEQKLDDIGVSLSGADMDEVQDMVISIVEADMLEI